jgi:uncharacterized Zn finger protein (UPF0148 family)
MSRRRQCIAVEQCPECLIWWRTVFYKRHGEWLIWCPVCGVVTWRAAVQLIDTATLTAQQQEAVKRTLRTVRNRHEASAVAPNDCVPRPSADLPPTGETVLSE